MGQKTLEFSEEGISQLPNNRSAVYKILTLNGNNNYTGIAQRGRVRERVMELQQCLVPFATILGREPKSILWERVETSTQVFLF